MIILIVLRIKLMISIFKWILYYSLPYLIVEFFYPFKELIFSLNFINWSFFCFLVASFSPSVLSSNWFVNYKNSWMNEVPVWFLAGLFGFISAILTSFVSWGVLLFKAIFLVLFRLSCFNIDPALDFWDIIFDFCEINLDFCVVSFEFWDLSLDFCDLVSTLSVLSSFSAFYQIITSIYLFLNRNLIYFCFSCCTLNFRDLLAISIALWRM